MSAAQNASEVPKMKTLELTVTFLTPAFLGDAEQNARWRTPPFKAEIRRWWRLVYAASRNFNVAIEEMRKREGRLFGNAWLKHQEGNREVYDFCKSQVRVRLKGWEKRDPERLAERERIHLSSGGFSPN
ncbi:MAG: hypothetical protein RML12_06125 [Xanthomonadales bacterium]|nr:hypothetical protein [Xanthomonadales bacterium]